MVTTKRAKAGEATVTFDGKWGINTRALQTYDIVEDAGEYYEMHYKSLPQLLHARPEVHSLAANIAANKLLTSNDPGGLGYNVFTVPDGQNLIGENGRLNPRAKQGRLVTDAKGQQFYLQPDNWLDEIYKSSSFRQEYNVSVSGATDRANFFASLGYLDNTGIVDGSSNERYTARLRADYQAKKWLKVGGNMSTPISSGTTATKPTTTATVRGAEGNADGGNAFATAIRMAPIYPVYMRDGNGNIMIDEYGFKMYDTGDGRNGGALRTNGGKSNDLQDIQLNKYINEGNAFMANGFADFSLYKGPETDPQREACRSTTKPAVRRCRTPTTDSSPNRAAPFSKATVGRSPTTCSSSRPTPTPSPTSTTSTCSSAMKCTTRKILRSVRLEDHDVLAGQHRTQRRRRRLVAVGFVGSEYNNEGLLLPRTVRLRQPHLFLGIVPPRRIVALPPDHRWGNFWSLGAAWIINRESWFNASWVNMLKVKASYGSQGNDNLGSRAESYYRYTDYREILSSGDGVTSVLYQKGNPDITWGDQRQPQCRRRVRPLGQPSVG